MVHQSCGHSLNPRIACGHCGEIVKPREIELVRAKNRPTVGDVMPREGETEHAA